MWAMEDYDGLSRRLREVEAAARAAGRLPVVTEPIDATAIEKMFAAADASGLKNPRYKTGDLIVHRYLYSSVLNVTVWIREPDHR